MPIDVTRCATLLVLFLSVLVPAAHADDKSDQVAPDKPVKKLILPGESFLVGDRPAFILWPLEAKRRQPQPWVMYSPTLPGLPDRHEKWMHEQFLNAGVAVAGVDIGEAYGSPEGQKHFTALYQELTGKRGFAKRMCLLGRSRGGLWISSWALNNTDKVAGLAGIYPVFDLRSYPGLARAAPAYGMRPEQLKASLSQHNPIAGTAKLATAKIPVFLIHGDSDKVVPLPENSLTLFEQYQKAGEGDLAELLVAKGQGHNFWPGFFRCQRLIDFTIEQAKRGAKPATATNKPQLDKPGVDKPQKKGPPKNESQTCGPLEEQRKRPNIVLFLVDDMGWQDTSVPFHTAATDFNRRYRTPNMERLAREGMKFTQAYACSVCSPTRVSLMTGMNAARHRVTNWTLRKNAGNDRRHATLNFPKWNVNGLSPQPDIERTIHAKALPAYLKEAGYRTIHVGKAHFGAIGTPGADPRNVGFDVNIGGHAAGGPGSFLGSQNFSAAWRKGDRVWDVPGLKKYHGTNTFLTEALTKEANAAVDQAVAAETPFFLYMSHYAVHVPFAKDDRFYDKYRESGLGHTESMYAAMVEGMDKSLGDILDNVKDKGQAENTIVLFMSDNGGLSASGRGGKAHTHNKPLSSGKGSAHEGGVRVPMIVSWPGVTDAGSVCKQPVIIEDFFSTILEMAGVRNVEQVGGSVDGRSFTPLLQGEDDSRDQRPLFWHFPNNWGPKGPGIGPSSSIRLGAWKLIFYYDDRRFELFSVAKDIQETHDLADDYPAMRNELAVKLRDYLVEVKAQLPIDKKTGKPVQIPVPDAAPLTP